MSSNKKEVFLSGSPWAKALSDAQTFYNKWSTKYQIQVLKDYYQGKQWRNKLTNTNTINYTPYTMNMTWATVQIKLASMIFQKPQFVLTAKPVSHWDEDSAVQSAEIKQDVLNTIAQNTKLKIPRHLKKVCLDAYLAFGMAEVGYAADWRNPLKEDPELKSDSEEGLSEDDDRVISNEQVSTNERIYVKRIRPERFRVAVTDEWDLDSIDWYGYYSYYYKRTLMKTKGITWPKNEERSIKTYNSTSYNSYGSTSVGEHMDFEDKAFLRMVTNQDIVRVWHIWDNRKKERLLLLDGNCNELWSESFERRSLFDLRWELDDGFYPVPPTYHWLSMQNEINEAREQTRSFRRRFTRKFQAVKGTVDVEEQEKFTSGPDGIICIVKQRDAITPIQNPEQGPTAEHALVLAKDDFNIISGTSSEARGQADRTTATQAKLIDSRSQIRESAEQIEFDSYFCEIGREILAVAAEDLDTSLWVRYSSSPTNEQESRQDPAYKLISSQDLSDGYDFDIQLDITNATPQSMAAAQQSYTSFMAMLGQFPMIIQDTDLIRETAYRCGYTNERIIKKIQAAAMQHAQMQQLMGGAGSQQGAGSAQAGPQTPGSQNANSTVNAQMQNPTMDQTMTQIKQQLM